MSNSTDLFLATADDLMIATEPPDARTFDPYQPLPCRPCGSVGSTHQGSIPMNSAIYVASALARLNVANRIGALEGCPTGFVGGLVSLPGRVGGFVGGHVSGLDFVGGAGVSGVGSVSLVDLQAAVAAAQSNLDAKNAEIAAGGTDFPGQMDAITRLATAQRDLDNAAAAAGAAASDQVFQNAMKQANQPAAPAPAHVTPAPAPAPTPAPKAGLPWGKLLLGAAAGVAVFHKQIGL